MALKKKLRPVMQELYATKDLKEIHPVSYWLEYMAKNRAGFETDEKTGEVTIYQGTNNVRIILKELIKY